MHEQAILEISQGYQLSATIGSFLIGRQEIYPHTTRFYREFLSTYLPYCNANSARFTQQITSDFLRRYRLAFAENYNPKGVLARHRCSDDSPWEGS